MLSIRNYQQKFIDAIHKAWSAKRAVLGVLPTGGGKTVAFTSIISTHQGAAAAIVHRNELVGQISMALAKVGVAHRMIAQTAVITRYRRKQLKLYGKSFIDPAAAVGVISVQTLTSPSSNRNAQLQAWIKQVTLTVLDEGAHYIKSSTWAKAVDAFPRAKLLFVTATPERADGKGLGLHADGYAEIMVEGPTTQYLIDEGYLSSFVMKCPKSDLSTEGVPLTASGDLNTKALRARVVASQLVGDVVQHYKAFAPGKQAIVFATDVKTAEEIAAAFQVAGVEAQALSGQSEPSHRDKTLDAFEDQRIQVLVNVDLFDEGFDVPGIDAVILARPTESLGKYLQMVGRVLRPVYAKGYDLSTREGRLAAMAAGPKPRALVIDPVRNWERHGAPNWPRKWTLDARVRGQSKAGLTPQRICLKCTQPYERFHLACPYCGEPVPAPTTTQRTLEQVDGDLEELDSAALAELFGARQRANMSDEEYALDQRRRNIPEIGRHADMKRHRARKHRREVLQNLINWWAGLHPSGRSEREIHKRFYLRFGVDVHTAFTLSEKDTDKLITAIQERFTDDIKL